jgi:ligand-binding SRPBCC domain-containing protein
MIHAPAERCCTLSLDAEAHADSMAHTGERAIAGRTTGIFGLGDSVTWEARHFGLVQRLEVRITALSFPSHFRDEMVRGAFRVMRHDHYFREEAGGITRMTDHFYYEAPLGILGRIADLLFLRRYMRRLLLRRNAFIRQLAEQDG